MRAERGRGRNVRKLAVLAALFAAAASAEPPPVPPPAAEATYQVAQPEGLRGRLLRDVPSPVRSLDPAVFTEISPVTASDPAVRLPPDQYLGPADGSVRTEKSSSATKSNR